MNNMDLILELLDDINPKHYCDNCISKELRIFPRQQVNQICRRLMVRGKLTRENNQCNSCKKIKLRT